LGEQEKRRDARDEKQDVVKIEHRGKMSGR
jgi:hypothetical protein